MIIVDIILIIVLMLILHEWLKFAKNPIHESTQVDDQRIVEAHRWTGEN